MVNAILKILEAGLLGLLFLISMERSGSFMKTTYSRPKPQIHTNYLYFSI